MIASGVTSRAIENLLRLSLQPKVRAGAAIKRATMMLANDVGVHGPRGTAVQMRTGHGDIEPDRATRGRGGTAKGGRHGAGRASRRSGRTTGTGEGSVARIAWPSPSRAGAG